MGKKLKKNFFVYVYVYIYIQVYTLLYNQN